MSLANKPSLRSLFTGYELFQAYYSMKREEITFADINLLSKHWPSYLGQYPLDVPGNVANYQQAEEQAESRGRESRHDHIVVLHDFEGVLILLDGYEEYRTYVPLVEQHVMPRQWRMWVLRPGKYLTELQKFQLAIFLTLRRVRFHEDLFSRNMINFLRALQIVMVNKELGFPERCKIDDLVPIMIEFLNACDGGLEADEYAEIIVLAATLLGNEDFFSFLSRFQQDIIEINHPLFRNGFLTNEIHDNTLTSVHRRWWKQESLPVQLLLTLLVMAWDYVPIDISRSIHVRRQVIRILRAVVDMVSIACQRFTGLSVQRTLLAEFTARLENGAAEHPRRSFQGAEKIENTILFRLAVKVAPPLTEALVPLELEDDGMTYVPHTAKLPQHLYLSAREQCLRDTDQVLRDTGVLQTTAMLRYSMLMPKLLR